MKPLFSGRGFLTCVTTAASGSAPACFAGFTGENPALKDVRITQKGEKKRMKKVLALIMTMAVVLSLAACGGDAPASGNSDARQPAQDAMAPAGDIEVAVVLKTLASEYWGYVKTGCDAAAADLGVKVTVVGPGAESDIEGQVSMIEQQIGAGCDAIVCAPNDAGAAIAALQSAIDQGIPVLAVDTNVASTGRPALWVPLT